MTTSNGGEVPAKRPPTRGHRGRRQRRLRLAAATLGLVALAAAGIVVWAYRAQKPETRRPGEDLPEITRRLARNLPAEAPEPVFVSATAAAGLDGFVSFAGERTSQLPEDMGAGAAWGDYDGDGDDDLFLVSAGGSLELAADELAPSRLYENLGDGTFRPAESFPELRIRGMAAAWGDYDRDGRRDLVVTGYDRLLLFRNSEDGFVPDPALPDLKGFWAGASWGDYDNDRDLDLYVAGYVRYETGGERGRTSDQYGAVVPFTMNPASYPPERNLLFENDGAGGFTEVAAARGVDNAAGRSLTALWHDFDDDGRLDLYVANDISDNALFLNSGNGFEDWSLRAWVADYRGAMGLAAGDWNRDGDDDLFITHWVAQENALYDSLLVDMAATRGAEGGVEGDAVRLAFSDVAAPRGLGQIALRFVGWGTEFTDFDSDGWLDLVVVNGSTFETSERPKRLEPQTAMLLWNQRGQYFHDLAPLVPALAEPRASRGLAVADYDDDGDVDIVVVHRGGVELLRNETRQGNWLKLRLGSRLGSGERLGVGENATVLAEVGDVVLRRSVSSASYLSQSSATLHLGLGDADEVARLEVRWPGGGVDTYRGLAASAPWQITEGEAEARRVDRPATTASSDRERELAFWQAQRAAMDAMKRAGDLPLAIRYFREALAIRPEHEDSRYYLSNCLAATGDLEAALAELDDLRRRNPNSQRAHKQWGVLTALYATSATDLAAAESALEAALAINPEETGTLLVLGELAMLQGRPELAKERLELACRTNPRAVGGFFLRAYLAHAAGDRDRSTALLEAARTARGEDWKPQGSVSEGDVARLMHREATPLSAFWEEWDGSPDPSTAFVPLAAFLAARESGSRYQSAKTPSSSISSRGSSTDLRTSPRRNTPAEAYRLSRRASTSICDSVGSTIQYSSTPCFS